MSGDAGDPDSPAPEFDDEQHIETFEQHSVDMVEVRRYDARRLGTQKLAPGGAVAPGSRAQAVVFHDPGNGARGQAHAEFAQFTLDTPVTPSRVLPCQSDDECGHLVVDGRTTW